MMFLCVYLLSCLSAWLSRTHQCINSLRLWLLAFLVHLSEWCIYLTLNADGLYLHSCWDLIVGKWCSQHSLIQCYCCCLCCFYYLFRFMMKMMTTTTTTAVMVLTLIFAYLPNRFVVFSFFSSSLDLHALMCVYIWCLFNTHTHTNILKAIKRGSLKGFKMMKKSLNSPVCSQHRANIIFIHTDCYERVCVS